LKKEGGRNQEKKKESQKRCVRKGQTTYGGNGEKRAGGKTGSVKGGKREVWQDLKLNHKTTPGVEEGKDL